MFDIKLNVQICFLEAKKVRCGGTWGIQLIVSPIFAHVPWPGPHGDTVDIQKNNSPPTFLKSLYLPLENIMARVQNSLFLASLYAEAFTFTKQDLCKESNCVCGG